MELPFSTHLSHAHGAAGVVDLGGVVVCTVVGSGVVVACSVVVSGVVLDCSVVGSGVVVACSVVVSGVVLDCSLVGSGVVVPCSVVVWDDVVVCTQSQSMPNNLQPSIELPASTQLSQKHGAVGVVDLGGVVVCTVVGSAVVVV